MKKTMHYVKDLRTTKKIKNPKSSGRKKLFNQKYHRQIIESMKKGQGISYFAAKIGVSKQTVYNWINENKEFKESFEIAQTACQAYWENLALNNALKAQGNGNQIQYQLSKRFKNDYGDTASVNIYNTNNQNVTKPLEEMTRIELEKYEAELLKKLESNGS